MLNGQKIVMNTVGENLDVEVRLNPPAATGRRGAPPQSSLIEAAGTRKMFTVAQQAEVNTDGMTLPATTAPAATTSTPAPVPAGAAKNAATSPPAMSSATAPAARGTSGSDVISIADYTSSWFGRSVTATGTITRVEASGPWELLYFKESADFVACFAAAVFKAPSSPLARLAGADFAGLVGKTAQLRGPVAPNLCAGKPGMRLNTPAQIQVAAGPTSDFCPLPFALCPCPLPFALCPLPFALCPLPFDFYVSRVSPRRPASDSNRDRTHSALSVARNTCSQSDAPPRVHIAMVSSVSASRLNAHQYCPPVAPGQKHSA
jgi:hypothetical protein